MNYAVEIENLKKYFGEVKAVDGLTFTVEEGKLFAFLGVNGAGKSTTINVMCSILQKDEGRVKLCGFDLDEEGGKIRAATGIVFQDSILDKALTVRENLAVRAGFYGLFGKAWEQRLGELCELLDLRELLGRPYGKLSGGQRRRTDSGPRHSEPTAAAHFRRADHGTRSADAAKRMERDRNAAQAQQYDRVFSPRTIWKRPTARTT